MKKRIMLAMVMLAMVPSITSCAKSNKPESPNNTALEEKDNKEEPNDTPSITDGMPNPFITCDDITEAEKMAGFTFSIPDKIEGYEDKTISVLKDKDSIGSMIQVHYGDIEEGSTVLIRKAKSDKDISGDYNDYNKKDVVKRGNIEITLNKQDDKVFVATWLNNNFSYSISASEGMNEETILSLAEKIK